MDETTESGTESTDDGDWAETESDDDSPGVFTRVKTVVTESVGVVVDAVIDAL
ncbi:hypothetical protein [Halorubrum pallidum]|uniref:Uncharacterized protein n=1 Tax=Halorubrum pallidum TaxID=1526114 RepID=A0ABD5T609_9EURY